MATTALDPISLPAAQEEQVQALHDLLRKEGKACLIGRGGEPACEGGHRHEGTIGTALV